MTLISLIDELTTLRDEEVEKERVAQLMFDEKGRERAFVYLESLTAP